MNPDVYSIARYDAAIGCCETKAKCFQLGVSIATGPWCWHFWESHLPSLFAGELTWQQWVSHSKVFPFSGMARCQQIPTGIWSGSRRGQGCLQPLERSWTIDHRKTWSTGSVTCFGLFTEVPEQETIIKSDMFSNCFQLDLKFLRRWTMHKFMTHEPLASGLFNKSHNSGKGQWAAWSEALQSSHDLLKLLTERMGNDYSQLTAKMRKPFSMKDVVTYLDFFPFRMSVQNITPSENMTHKTFTFRIECFLISLIRQYIL